MRIFHSYFERFFSVNSRFFFRKYLCRICLSLDVIPDVGLPVAGPKPAKHQLFNWNENSYTCFPGVWRKPKKKYFVVNLGLVLYNHDKYFPPCRWNHKIWQRSKWSNVSQCNLKICMNLKKEYIDTIRLYKSILFVSVHVS